MCVKLFPDPPPLSVTSRPSGVAGGTGRLQFPLLLSCETLLWLSVRGGDFRDFCLGRGRKFVAGKNDERSIIISKSVFFFLLLLLLPPSDLPGTVGTPLGCGNMEDRC